MVSRLWGRANQRAFWRRANHSRYNQGTLGVKKEMAVVSVDVVEEGLENNVGFPFWTACRRRYDPFHSFFASGDVERELLAKQIALDVTEVEGRGLVEVQNRNLFCPIVGCGIQLTSLEAFEEHYVTRHSASCSVCGRVYPTTRLLSIHVSETHDSFFQAKVARGCPMYECLVEGCGMKFKSDKSRKQHLINKHKFPTSFEFLKKNHPSKQQRQRQRQHQHRLCHTAKESSFDAPNHFAERGTAEVSMEIEGKMNELVTAVSRLNTDCSLNPSNISFGHPHARGLLVPRSVQQQRKPCKSTRE